MKGLTLNQVLKIVEPDIPTDAIGDVLKRLPARFFDQESQLFRPIAPAVLMALDLVAPHDDEGGRKSIGFGGHDHGSRPQGGEGGSAHAGAHDPPDVT